MQMGGRGGGGGGGERRSRKKKKKKKKKTCSIVHSLRCYSLGEKMWSTFFSPSRPRGGGFGRVFEMHRAMRRRGLTAISQILPYSMWNH